MHDSFAVWRSKRSVQNIECISIWRSSLKCLSSGDDVRTQLPLSGLLGASYSSP
jgi:hypothetical protein